MIQMKGSLSARPKTNRRQAIQQRLSNFYACYDNGDINTTGLLDVLSYVLAKTIA